ncbi:MAG: hypothetical protein ABI386_09950 [Rhodanobacter sp.]
MPTSPRLALVATMIAGVLLASCTPQPTTRPEVAVTTRRATTAPATPVPPPGNTTTRERSAAKAAPSDAVLPDNTGITACDDYLSSYMACHRAAAIFAPDQLQSRYDTMRTTLLRDSQNPDIRPQLAERCNSLARSLRQALHGKACATEPSAATSSP